MLLLGEAPGRQEDLNGEPFVGQAGRVLDDLLASVGLSRHDVYITNVVKSRPFTGPPPGRNRAPAPREIAACRAWLDEQLRLLRPQIVVTLGRIALESLLPGRRLSQVHGQPQRQGNYIVLPLYHPAVALYRRQLAQTLRRDFRALQTLLGPRGRKEPFRRNRT